MKPRSILDPKFRYLNSATHEDGGRSFHRRMQARRLLAQRKARQEATATPATVTTLPRKVKP